LDQRGISSGIDLAFELIAEIAGKEEAERCNCSSIFPKERSIALRKRRSLPYYETKEPAIAQYMDEIIKDDTLDGRNDSKIQLATNLRIKETEDEKSERKCSIAKRITGRSGLRRPYTPSPYSLRSSNRRRVAGFCARQWVEPDD
jgi:hypothetical protein